MPAVRVSHPVFARVLARIGPCMEAEGGAEHRREALAGLRGRVLEVGAGAGPSFPHYPAEVTEVVALEPEPYLRRLAVAAARDAGVPVRVVDAVAESLPFEAGAFDAAVCALVLCSVEDPGRALAELRRVLRPGGELRLYEHVRARDERFARWQALARRGGWTLFAGGCHPDRDTLQAVRDAGFRVEGVRRFPFPPSRPGLGGALARISPARPHVVARARAG